MKTAIVVPTWNKVNLLLKCLKSLEEVKGLERIYVVDNGSTDGTKVKLEKLNNPKIALIRHEKNHGFAGGVNAGIFCALADGYDSVALLNNDALVESVWLSKLQKKLGEGYGIVGSIILDDTGETIDTAGDFMTSWGLPFPKGRGETLQAQAPGSMLQGESFAACAGAVLIKKEVFEAIGYFDEDFFAYYEDVDFCYRARHAGFKIGIAEEAIVYHAQGSTSKGIKGFTTHQTMKNLPLVQLKNAPGWLYWRTLPRLTLAMSFFYFRAIMRGDFWPATKGIFMALWLTPRKTRERREILKNSRMSRKQLENLIVWDLPPNAFALRKARKVLSAGRIK